MTVPSHGKFAVIMIKLKLNASIIYKESSINKTNIMESIEEKFSSIDLNSISAFKDNETLVTFIYNKPFGIHSFKHTILEHAVRIYLSYLKINMIFLLV